MSVPADDLKQTAFLAKMCKSFAARAPRSQEVRRFGDKSRGRQLWRCSKCNAEIVYNQKNLVFLRHYEHDCPHGAVVLQVAGRRITAQITLTQVSIGCWVGYVFCFGYSPYYNLYSLLSQVYVELQYIGLVLRKSSVQVVGKIYAKC